MTERGDTTAAASYLTTSGPWWRVVWSWATTRDHKRIGVMYLCAILAAFLLGGVAAILIRTHHLTFLGPGQTTHGLFSPDNYNRTFTIHGAVMIFMVLIPSIPASLGNFILPLMLGAKDVAFPRLNLLSLYLYGLGYLFMIVVLFTGSLDTGWTFYTPYSTDVTNTSNVILATLGIFILGFSSILTGINFIVSIHHLRPPGMTWFRMPLMLWGLYATAIVQVLATPVLAITLLLLAAEKWLHVEVFSKDPVLFQHFFWFYSHPAVYIMILPGMGIISELIATFSHKELFGYRFVAYSSIAIGLVGFLVWGHHMFVATMSAQAAAVFSALTFAVAIPSAVKVFNWLSTLHRGSIRLATPMCYALAFLFLFSIGGLTGLFLGALGVDMHLTGTYFVVAHFHYVMVGGGLFAFFGGLHYWWPKMFGRMYSEFWGRLGCAVNFAGFNLTFFPQFIAGTHGNPRRVWNNLPRFHSEHVLSTWGTYILAAGFLITAGCLIHGLLRGRRAPPNPWGSISPEWQCPSPPPTHNFDTPPVITRPYDQSLLEYDAATDGYVLKKSS